MEGSLSYFGFQARLVNLQQVLNFYTCRYENNEYICCVKWGCHVWVPHRSSPRQVAVWGSPGPPSGSVICWKDSQNLEKLLYFVVTVYCSQGHRLTSAKGRGAWGRVWQRPGRRPQVSPWAVPWGQCSLLQSWRVATHRQLPAREARTGLGVQSF